METTKLDFINDFTLLPEYIRINFLKKIMENYEKAYIREFLNKQLFDAVECGNIEIVKMMIQFGADKDMKDKDGDSALHYAAQFGHTDVVKLLLDAGAVKEVKNNDGATPLHYAIGENNFDAVKLLLDAGAEMEVKDEDGKTPLHWAAESTEAGEDGYTDIVELLLDMEADKEVKDKWGKTPLYLAAENDHNYIIKVFLDYGVQLSTVLKTPTAE
tara:strand:+ start:3997 stop:4641 length:645 start_codon:yes stop_codon:yes gene_type:complete